ncbi:FHA domain-containing protein PS1-like [Bidens hawaiensis]|uniref:FHA domain-containing protein PS1-like n=1 Tax=Bidens hawaiensis TaxID=980011 RepID=UPI004049EA77
MDTNTNNNNKIPAFTVIKNGSILKNIFLIRKPSATPQSQDSGELILLVGRHPHCHITLEHPSISRHHLRIHSNPSAQTLSVVDLSSVHGTWVSGRKIKPRVHVKLKEGDTMRLGASSRVYELHWVPRSQAYDVDEQFVPAVCTINEESDRIADEKHEECLYDDDLECLGVSSSNEIRDSPLKALDPLTALASDYVGSDTEAEHSGPLTGDENDDIFASGSIQASPVVSETASAAQVSDNLNGLEDQLISNGSKSSCDDTEVEHSGPLTGNENDDIFASVSVQSPLVVSETTSATQVSDKLNGLEDQLMSNDSKTLCDVTEVEHSGLLTGNENDDIFAAVTIEAPLVVLETTSATRVSDNLNGVEDQLMSNVSKSSCDDTEVEHSGPLTGNENDDVFAGVTIEAPLVVSETASATRVSDNVNNAEDQLKTNCSISSCDDTEIDHSSPWKDDENVELFTTVCIEVPLVASEDASEKETSDCSKSSCDDNEVEHTSPMETGNEKGELFTTVCIQAPLVVPETTSATQVSDSVNGSEDQLMLSCLKPSCDDTEVKQSSALIVSETISTTWVSDKLNNEDQLMTSCSKSSCDNDTEVEQTSPCKTGNEDGELFTTAYVQAPLVALEDISETAISDCLNKSEDQLMLNCSKSSCDDTEVERSSPGKTDNVNGELITTVCVQAPLIVSEATSATQVSENLNNSEDQLMANFSKCDDDTEVEQTSPWKTGNNGEPFTTVCVKAQLVASEDASETEISDCLNKSEDKFDWLRDNLSNEFDHISHEKDEAHDLFNAIETHENDDFNESIANSEIDSDNEDQQKTDNCSDKIRDVGCEIEQVNQMRMMEESATMVLSDGVDMSVNIESVDHETMKKESVFELLPDVAEMDEDKTFTPDKPEAKEMHTNLLSAQKLSASMKLFDRLDGKEVEFYTPDIENKNPNACSGISLSKQAVNPIVSEKKDIFGISQKLFATDEGVHTEHKVDQFVNDEEVLSVSSEKESKSAQKTQNIINSSQNFTKKRWTMVVDTSSLLDPKSLKHMKLLEGIKQTQLVVPKIVVRELMDINSQVSFFNRDSKKASLALKWIDECMMNTRWWIHMDDDDDEAVHSSTEVPDVLAVALRLREQITDEKIIILSDSLTLKIKAMAEGIMCEAAEEFRESLVNPFSERFLWVGSSARGLTWSCVDDHEDILRPKYQRFGYNGSQRFEAISIC